MRKTMMWRSIVPALVLVAGCSSSTETVPAQVTLDPAVAKSQASALTTAVAGATAGRGVDVAAALAPLANAAVGLVPTTQDASRGQVAAAGVSTCTCPSGAVACTFTGCTIGKAVVSGTLSWASGTLTCDKLAFAVPAASSTVGAVDIAVDCAFTYTASQVSGSLHTTGTAEVDQAKYTWDATLQAKAVTFTASAVTGGTVDVSATVTGVSTQRGTEAYAGTAAVTLP
jgi:hypothetical protein